MSAAIQRKGWISPEEYLRNEELSDVRHEYCAGEIYPIDGEAVGMAGASVEHNFITGNIFAALHAHLAGKPCFAFVNDMKAHLAQRGDEWFYYPDVMVNCDPAGQQKYYCDTPSLIVEVLSPHTERRDKLEKRLAYELVASLHTYVLVAQDRRELTIFRRGAQGWEREILPEQGDVLRVPELEFSTPLEAIYARTGL